MIDYDLLESLHNDGYIVNMHYSPQGWQCTIHNSANQFMAQAIETAFEDALRTAKELLYET